MGDNVSVGHTDTNIAENEETQEIRLVPIGGKDEDVSDTLHTVAEKENIAVISPLVSEKISGSKSRQKRYVTKRTVYKNLIILSIAFLLLFAAFQSLQNLQSSINVAEGLGNAGLTVLYVSFLISCVFLPSLMLSKLGMKWTMVMSVIAYLGYIGAAFHATWATIIPTSVLLGVLAATLWTGQLSYVAELARLYADITRSKLDECSSRFFGIFYGIYHTGE